MSRPNRAVTIKKRLSFALLAIQIVLFAWRILDPGILSAVDFRSVIFVALVLSLSGIVMIIGWFGAMLTFPIEKD
jgi:hypothetical protein